MTLEQQFNSEKGDIELRHLSAYGWVMLFLCQWTEDVVSEASFVGELKMSFLKRPLWVDWRCHFWSNLCAWTKDVISEAISGWAGTCTAGRPCWRQWQCCPCCCLRISTRCPVCASPACSSWWIMWSSRLTPIAPSPGTSTPRWVARRRREWRWWASRGWWSWWSWWWRWWYW